MRTLYEVQFLDGLGVWRRWSICTTPNAADRSLKRLQDLIGISYLSRISEVRRP